MMRLQFVVTGGWPLTCLVDSGNTIVLGKRIQNVSDHRQLADANA